MWIDQFLHPGDLHMLISLNLHKYPMRIFFSILHLRKLSHTMRCVAELEFELEYS